MTHDISVKVIIKNLKIRVQYKPAWNIHFVACRNVFII